ncbi:MAG: asparagine synthase B [Deltaproteobacteria bacterium]|nr:asparagine synthase B [Deltaproteobacteria bacterium]
MCGILAVMESPESIDALRPRVVALAKRLRHRGPDWSGVHVQQYQSPDGRSSIHILAHERLAIVDPEGGAQPLLNETGKLALAVNGEIYNHVALRKGLKNEHHFKTKSDCEVILHLYEERGADFIDDLDGVFSFVLCDEETGQFIAARDPIGVVPLYWGWGPDGSTWFASEMKALQDVCQRFEPFPPGHVYVNKELKRYADPTWRDSSRIPVDQPSDVDLMAAFEQAVVKRMMSDVPYGVLLSGGLDSSLVSSIVSRHTANRMEDDFQSPAWWPRLHSFCIGLEGAPDLAKARKVADFLGTAHHELLFTVQEGLDALSEVIYHIETYDVTTIRASTPMFLMARKIKAMGVKMVFTGEGADEVFGGYLYFHKAPDAKEFHEETVRKVEALHNYDCLRANKSMAAWGVEARVPFLDKAFLELAMNMDPKQKMINASQGQIEKQILRQAFDNKEAPYLPDEILWRQKEQFSDGVGYGWIDALKAFAEEKVSDSMFEARAHRFPHKTPQTKEGYLYRTIFEEHFPQQAAIEGAHTEPSIACSSEVALRWDEAWETQADPSGRAIGAHQSAYRKS